MKTLKLLIGLVFTGALLILTSSCKKDDSTEPVLTTDEVSDISVTTAICGGTITSDGGKTVISRGVCWSTNINPTINDGKTTDGGGAGLFTSNITGLSEGTTYYVKAYATNSAGTGYGITISFKTLGETPIATTQAATNVLHYAATLNGIVNANYVSTIVTFEYGINTSYGQEVTAWQGPLTDSYNKIVSANITGLSGFTTYHFRVKAVNSLGTTYGSDLTFSTTATGTVTDIEGNTYNTITIGTQIWMKENLKTTMYRNGDLIGTTTPAILNISNENTPKYQWAYDGNESNVATYGRLYTWYAATDSRNVCPSGWHVPTFAEWTTLTDYLKNNGYYFLTAKSLASTSGWTTNSVVGNVGNDQASNNSSGFTALPGGYRATTSYFTMGNSGYWWSSTESPTTDFAAWGRCINYIGGLSQGYYSMKSGYSVRCVKD